MSGSVRLLALSAASLLAVPGVAQKVFGTSASGMRLQPVAWEWQRTDDPSDAQVVINPNDIHQTVMGFGGAFTEATALNFRGLIGAVQEQLLEMYFGQTGHRLTIGRIPINSCDFSAISYNFDNVADDFDMTQFDRGLGRDHATGMIDMINRATMKVRTTGEVLKMFGSPWSPPPWMKEGNHPMVGSAIPCLKGDRRYHSAWAKYLSTWIQSYQAAGVEIFAITVQNEPAFYSNNGWEACSFTPEAERDFIRDFIGPQLTKDFGWGNKKIIAYDWNKQDLTQWAEIIMADPGASQYVWGFGVHWYSGDFFDQVYNTASKYAGKPVLATEGCNCMYDLNMYGDEWSRAIRYAHDIIGDFIAGAIGWTDWNLLLDIESGTQAGGPNHAGNLCYAQIHTVGGQLRTTASYFAFGQFSRFLLPGSVVLGRELTGCGSVEALTARRVDGQFVAVLINRAYSPVRAAVQVTGFQGKLGLTLPPQSVVTAVFPNPKNPDTIIT